MENSVKVIAVPPPCASIQGSINSKAVVLDNIFKYYQGFKKPIVRCATGQQSSFGVFLTCFEASADKFVSALKSTFLSCHHLAKTDQVEQNRRWLLSNY